PESRGNAKDGEDRDCRSARAHGSLSNGRPKMTCTTLFPSQVAFSHCSSGELRPNVIAIVQGLGYTFGSSMVALYSQRSAATKLQRSVTRIASLWKLPTWSNQVLSLWFFTSTTSVLPSQ